MRSKAMFASFATLSMMSFFILVLVSPVMMAALADQGGFGLALGLGLGIGITVLVNVIMWLISPWLMDGVNRWVYRCRDTSLEELGQLRPGVAQFIYQCCQQQGIPVPRLKLIDDMNPTAYCYGSTASNARLVVTRGLLHYLDDEELKSVYAHELGHIVHRDFIVMTIASTLLTILWQIYIAARSFKNSRNNKGGEVAAALALIAWVFWWVSQYMLLYLSRAREYYADEFAGQATNNPNALAMALVKVAYGIARQPSTDFATKLRGGTRALGIADPKSAQSTGYAFAAANNAGHQMAQSLTGQQAPEMQITADSISRIEKVFLFDLFNPWAKVLELGSTHPLTGRRIEQLCKQAGTLNQRPLFQFQPIDAYGRQLDQARLHGSFVLEVGIWFAPQILSVLVAFSGIFGVVLSSPGLAAFGFAGIIMGYGLGATLRGFYMFPALGQPQQITVMELMMDPYASPLKGRPVMTQGAIVGRADAGSRFSEDMMMEDVGGGLISLNYESPIPLFGNTWFGWKKLQPLIGQQVQATGWFRRGIGQQIDLSEMRTAGGETVSSYTGFWGRAGGVAIFVLGLLISGAAAFAASNVADDVHRDNALGATAGSANNPTPMPTTEPSSDPAPNGTK